MVKCENLRFDHFGAVWLNFDRCVGDLTQEFEL